MTESTVVEEQSGNVRAVYTLFASQNKVVLYINAEQKGSVRKRADCKPGKRDAWPGAYLILPS
jgi:hypothetical protein